MCTAPSEPGDERLTASGNVAQVSENSPRTSRYGPTPAERGRGARSDRPRARRGDAHPPGQPSGNAHGDRHVALAGLGELPAPQADALGAALALGPPSPGDRLAVCVATVGLLSLAAHARPVLVVVDDMQWLDMQWLNAASHECIRFAARRAAGGSPRSPGSGHGPPRYGGVPRREPSPPSPTVQGRTSPLHRVNPLTGRAPRPATRGVGRRRVPARPSPGPGRRPAAPRTAGPGPRPAPTGPPTRRGPARRPPAPGRRRPARRGPARSPAC